MRYMSVDEAKVVAVLGDRAELGKVKQALDVLYQRVVELEREKNRELESRVSKP